MDDLVRQSLRNLMILEGEDDSETVDRKLIAIQQAEAKTVCKVLDRIDQVAVKRANEGFSRHNFAIGVLNCFFVAFMFGAYPQHCWLVFLVELSILLPIRVSYSCKRKPLNEVLYYLDYCWVMNFIGVFILLGLLVDRVTDGTLVNDEFRFNVLMTLGGVACGPLLGATLILPFVSVVFHDVNIMAGTFIHIIPPLIMYTFMWHSQEIREAWPGIFHLDYLEYVQFLPEGHFVIIPGTYLGTVAGNTLALYLTWWILYVIWMLLIGLDLPKKNKITADGSPIVPKYDTVFHVTMRDGLAVAGGKLLWGRPASISRKHVETNDFELRDFFAYMAFHALMAYMAVLILARSCYNSQGLHGLWLIFLTVICVSRGAVRYTYYVTKMYGHSIRKEFADLLANDDNAMSDKTKAKTK